MSEQQPLYCKIDDLVLDESTATLMRGDDIIELPNLSFALLVALVRSAPAIVSQTKIMHQVWGDKVVSDEAIQQRVKLLRQALNDNPSSPKYIATIRSKGYRLVAEVTPIARTLGSDSNSDVPMDEPPVSGRNKSHRKAFSLLAFLFVAITSSIVIFNNEVAQPQDPVETNKKVYQSNNPKAQDFFLNANDYASRNDQTGLESAIVLFKQSLELDPDFAAAHSGLAVSYVLLVANFGAEDTLLELGIEHATKAIGLDPDIQLSYLALGISFELKKQYDLAMTNYQKTLEYSPDDYSVMINLALMNLFQSQLESAIRYGFRAVQKHPRQAGGYKQIANVYWRLGLNTHAIAWYKKSLEFAPDNLNTHRILCRVYLSTGNIEAATKSCSDIVEWWPNSNVGYEWLAELSLLDNDEQQAIEYFNKAMVLDSSYGQMRYALLTKKVRQQKAEVAFNQNSEYNKETTHEEEIDKVLNEAWRVIWQIYHQNKERFAAIRHVAEYYALIGDKKQMLNWIQKATDAGFVDYGYWLNHSSFASYQTDTEFQQQMQLIKDKTKQLQQEFPNQLIIQPEQLADLDFVALPQNNDAPKSSKR